MRVYNTLHRKIEDFIPISAGKAGIYDCGPTVYNYAHIGNLRTYVFEDLLRRALEYEGFEVTHVMNITDVGHLTGDGDDGEDKITKSAREKKKTVWEIADFYADAFFKDIEELNILAPTITCRATAHIDDMIELIRRIEEKGYTYTAGGNVYFDISKFPGYGELARLDKQELRAGARIRVDENKRNPQDFVLWFTNSKFEHQAMMWDSPWGRGYPGWHIECSAMSMKYLGEHFDIHCGGIDHIPVHHTNEIAQSEAATGKKWVNYWIHGEFLVMEAGKMAKSAGSFITLPAIVEEGYDPMDYRYLCLGAHYRSQLQFSYDSLDSARSSRVSLFGKIVELQKQQSEGGAAEPFPPPENGYLDRFNGFVSNDLNIPRALAELWGAVKDTALSPDERLKTAYRMDKVLGLDLAGIEQEREEDLTPEERNLIKERETARKEKNFKKADEIRNILVEKGIICKDTPQGTEWYRAR
jgi:cysteinyl-tRNA synthetase